MPALAPALMPEELAGAGVRLAEPCPEGKDVATAVVEVMPLLINDILVKEIPGVCVVTTVSEVAAVEELEFTWLTATNLAFGSANSIAFGAFGCWPSRTMMEIPDVCSVKLDAQSSCHSHCQTPCLWQGMIFTEVLRCSMLIVKSDQHVVGKTKYHRSSTIANMKARPSSCRCMSLG